MAIIIVLILVIAVIGTIFYTQKSTQPTETIPSQSSALETTQFSTYNNPGDGIRIKYPKDWTKQEKIMGMNVIFSSPLESDSDTFQENVNVIVQDLSAQPMTLDEYTKLSLEQVKQIVTDASIPYSSATTLDGNSANRIIYTGRVGIYNIKWMQIYTIKDNTAYILTYTAETDKYNDFLDTAQEMINSFEII
ncbi:MAG: PsbP-related protein [Nitrospirota bacterium]